MRVRSRLHIAIPSFCLIFFPAFYRFVGGGNIPYFLEYYMALGCLAAIAPFGYDLIQQWSNQRSHRPRSINSLGGLGFNPCADGLADTFPEHRAAMQLITDAIETGRFIQFRYLKDDGDNKFKVIKPGYIHEHRRHSRHEAALCVNGFYPDKRSHINFSLQRMSEISILEDE